MAPFFQPNPHSTVTLDLTSSYSFELVFDRKPATSRLFAVSGNRLYYTEDSSLVVMSLSKLKQEASFTFSSPICGLDCWEHEVAAAEQRSCC